MKLAGLIIFTLISSSQANSGNRWSTARTEDTYGRSRDDQTGRTHKSAQNSFMMSQKPVQKAAPASSCSGTQGIKRRILSGEPVMKYDFPHQLSAFCQMATFEAFCGGTLISAKYALASAHCTCEVSKGKIIPARNCIVNGGGINIEKKLFGSEVSVKTQNITCHPEYDTEKLIHDIAVWKLETPLTLGGDIWFASLPSRSMSKMNFSGAWCQTAGYGSVIGTDIASMSEQLMKVDLKVVSPSSCSNVTHPSIMCTSGLPGSICYGDSGGGLMCRESCSRLTLVGIASFVKDYSCASDSNGFVFIPNELDFIRKYTNSEIPIREQ